MKKGMRKCVVCGKEYEFCPTCAETVDEPTWKLMFHNANCREIYNISTAYLAKKITKEEAIERYGKTDLSVRDNITTDFLQEGLNECLSSEKKEEKVETKEVETKQEVKQSNNNQKKTFNNYKKNKRK